MNNKIDRFLESASSESKLIDDIDLNYWIQFFKRNIKFISIFTFISVLVGTISAFTTPKIWKGEFQIVLDDKGNTNSIESMIPKNIPFLNDSFSSKDLQTEVGILESPLVLEKVFNYVRERQSLKNKSKKSNLFFRSWKNNFLNVELEKNTSILNIAYINKDRESIIPVLNLISESYQNYSGRQKLRNIELGKKFFEEQIALYKFESLQSLKEAQDFGMSQNLSIVKNDSSEYDDLPVVNTEILKLKNKNNLRKIDIQLNQLENIQNPEEIVYLGMGIPELVDQGLPQQLDKIETEIVKKKYKYLENDEVIVQLKSRKKILRNLIKDKAKKYLVARKVEALTNIQAAEREEGVLFKYKQLITKAAKDKATLDSLENQYRTLLLQEAKSDDPWELITSPTLLPEPIAPMKKKIVAIYLFLGTMFASLISFVIEKRKDIIYDFSEISKLCVFSFNNQFNFQKTNSLQETIFLLSKSGILEEVKSIAVITFGEIGENNISKIRSEIENYLPKSSIDILQNYNLSKEYDKYIFITVEGISKKQDVINMIEKLKLFKEINISNIFIKQFLT